MVNESSTITVLGSKVHLVNTVDTVDQIEAWIAEPRRICRRVIVTGFHGLWEAHQDRELKKILNSAELWIPDGIAPVWLARLKGNRHAERATGVDVMREFFRRASARGYRCFFYGDTERTLDALRRRLDQDFPGHIVAGSFSPPFRPLTKQEDERIIAQINEAKPDVLWVGLGMPKQERWIYDRQKRLSVPVAIGVGAAFAFAAGTVQRCPDWIGSMGMEWVFRLTREPRKLWRRDLLDGPRFLFNVGLELARIRKYE
jgi:N-acetylglucosaminyldiphosphoundecaprenol N-acetyl-beta-D-mannosaminyltransferase